MREAIRQLKDEEIDSVIRSEIDRSSEKNTSFNTDEASLFGSGMVGADYDE